MRYKYLLAARLLFLLFLLLAFTQPFWSGGKNEGKENALSIIYIDNSQSMSLKTGARSMLDIAKENAAALVAQSTGSFLILSNDQPSSYTPVSRQQAIEAIASITISSNKKNNTQILSEVRSMIPDKNDERAVLYYISDFQQNIFASTIDKKLLGKLQFNGIQIPQTEVSNVYIDTAFFENPFLQNSQNNKLIVRTKYEGKTPESATVLQLSVQNKIKSAASINFGKDKEHYDTLSFQSNDNNWQSILLSINDPKVHFDDSFRIAARSNSELSVLLASEGQANIFIRAALGSYSGFKVKECSTNQLPEDLSSYNLILVNGLTQMDKTIANKLKQALQNGQNVCLFFRKMNSFESINNGLKSLGDLSIQGLDTSAQTVSTLQSENRLLKEMFERIPENVQLPFSENHYQIKAGLSANQQYIFSFRNGDPFFAQYKVQQGQLYICATPPEPQFGNFQSSYFFVPFLYQMASIAKGSQIFAITTGQKEPIFVPQNEINERSLLHIYAAGVDIIPAQKAEGMGVKIFAGENLKKPGFYIISGANKDSCLIGVNRDREESKLSVWALNDLKQNWKGKQISWQIAEPNRQLEKNKSASTFPLWKLCSILALIMLGIESYLLSKNLLKSKTITN